MKEYQDKSKLEELYKRHRSAYAIADYLGVNYKTIYYWMKKYELETNIGSQGARRHWFDENFFSTIDTEPKAYWLGFIMADGCVYKGSDKNSYRLQINLKGSDINHLNKFQAEIKSAYKIQQKKVKDSDVAILKINSTKMCYDLMELGVTPRKSLVCEMPNIPKELIRHFIRGYLDGDGSIIKNARNQWVVSITGGEPMLNAIDEWFFKHGVYAHIYDSQSNALQLMISRGKDVVGALKLLYDDSTVYLERKKQNFLECVEFYECPPQK